MEKFLLSVNKNKNIIVTAFLILGIIPIFLIETQHNVPFYFAFKFLLLPIIVLAFYIGIKYKNIFFSNDKLSIKNFLTIIAFTFVITLMSGSFISLINAIIPPQEKVIVEGTVIDKSELSGKRSKSKFITIKTTDEKIKWEVDEQTYNSLQVGYTYSNVFTKGGLGIIYKWKNI